MHVYACVPALLPPSSIANTEHGRGRKVRTQGAYAATTTPRLAGLHRLIRVQRQHSVCKYTQPDVLIQFMATLQLHASRTLFVS